MSESECGDGADDGDVCKSVCACVRVSSQATMMTGIVNFFLKLPRPLGRLFLVEEVGVEQGCQMWTLELMVGCIAQGSSGSRPAQRIIERNQLDKADGILSDVTTHRDLHLVAGSYTVFSMRI